MSQVKLQELDAHNFVYRMLQFASSTKYMYESQIKGLIDYTKHYYACGATDEELTVIFTQSIRNLGY